MRILLHTCSWEAQGEWFQGKHEAIIPEDLLNLCQDMRAAKASHHEYYPKYRTYLLRDVLFCAHCVETMPQDVQDDTYGKMRAHTVDHGKYLIYRCRAHSWGRRCPQRAVHAEAIEEQVVAILEMLKPPEDWRRRQRVDALRNQNPACGGSGHCHECGHR